MSIRAILIIPTNHAAKLSIVAAQMGYTQDFTQGVNLCALATEATPSTPATHYMVNDAGMSPETESKFRQMAAGEYLPQVVWANIPDITETSANAAANALQVVSEAGGNLGDLATILAAKGLQLIPSGVEV